MADPTSRLLEAHMRQIIRLEDAAVTRLFGVYQQAHLEIIGRLAALDSVGRGDTFRAQHLALIRQQVDNSLRVMTQNNAFALRSAFEDALQAGARQTHAEVVELETRFGSPELAARVSAVPPVIPAEQVAMIADPQRLLLARFSGRIEEGVSRALAQSVLQGEGMAKATRRLRDVLTGERWQLERIARTEIQHAANFAHHATIADVAQQFPEMGLQKQWSAILERRTCSVCRRLDGDVKDHDQEFAPNVMYPPRHPNCRCRCNPYSKRWTEGKQQRTERQKAAIERAFR